jgi:hypothetical protein
MAAQIATARDLGEQKRIEKICANKFPSKIAQQVSSD